MYKKLILSLIVAGLAFSGPVSADPFEVTIDDETIIFNGWSGISGNTTKDAIGIPDIDRAVLKATLGDDGIYLESIEFFYSYGSASFGGSNQNVWENELYPGDLFMSIGTGALEYWNYVVDLPDGLGARNAQDFSIYNLGADRPIGDLAASLPYLTASAPSANRVYREDHPYGVNVAGYAAETGVKVTFDGWKNPVSQAEEVSSIFEFFTADNGGWMTGWLLPGSENYKASVGTFPFQFGWTQMCANDVITGQVAFPGGGNEIPEPGTLLLLGTGLVGLVARRRRQS